MSTVKSSPSLLESGEEDEARRLAGEADWDEASCGDSVRARLASSKPLTSKTGDGVSGFIAETGRGGGLHSRGGGSFRLGSSVDKARIADRAGGPPLLPTPVSCFGDCRRPNKCALPSLSNLIVVSSVLVSLPVEAPLAPCRCTRVSSMSCRNCSAESFAFECNSRRALRNSGSNSNWAMVTNAVTLVSA